MKVEIEFIKESEFNEDGTWKAVSGYKVTSGDKWADGLSWDEMLGVVTMLTMPEHKPCLQWMKTKEGHDAFNKKYPIANEVQNGEGITG